MPGQIIILNGAPRSGKSSIAEAIQESYDGIWMKLGVDLSSQGIPSKVRPGIGLRPGGERPDLEAVIPMLYAALYESIAAHSRLDLNVVVDIGHHDSYSTPLNILQDCLRRLEGLPVIFVGVRCPLEVILERRRTSPEGSYLAPAPGEGVPDPILRWQTEVHKPGIYDMEVDTSRQSPKECAENIRTYLLSYRPVSALDRILGH